VSTLASSRRARARLLPRIARAVVRVLRFLFILALVSLPVPLATCLALILTPLRRNLPAEVLRMSPLPSGEGQGEGTRARSPTRGPSCANP
jgi:hypothetical protein